MNLPKTLLLTASLFLLSSCGPSLDERVQQATTPELLMEAGEDVLESIEDQASLDQGKIYIVQLHSNYKLLDSKSKEELYKRFLRENKEIHKEIERILQLDLSIGNFTDPVIDQHIRSVLRLLKEMNKPIRLK